MTSRRAVYADLVRRFGLPLWFGLMSAALMVSHIRFGAVWFFDATLYVEATKVWLAGGDPWSVRMLDQLFAAPPPTLLVLAPFAIVPGGMALLVGTVALGAVLTIRMLRLPWWWLLFPPLVEGVFSGNIQMWLVPLLLARVGPVAVFAKVYAAVPLVLLGRWREVGVTVGALALTAPFLAWDRFIAALPAVTAALAEQSTYRLPPPLLALAAPFALWALWRVGDKAPWLAVPALWPSQQWYYATLAMPAGALACAVVSIPVAGSGLLALFVVALRVQLRDREPLLAHVPRTA